MDKDNCVSPVACFENRKFMLRGKRGKEKVLKRVSSVLLYFKDFYTMMYFKPGIFFLPLFLF
jgi:hypothetical protein